MDKRLIDEAVKVYTESDISNRFGDEMINYPESESIDTLLEWSDMTEAQFIEHYIIKAEAPAVCMNCHDVALLEPDITYAPCENCGMEHSVMGGLVLLEAI